MSVNHDIAGVEVYGKGQCSFKLPCGYVDAAGTVHNEIIMREMTGMEEDVMDDDSTSVTDRISKILAQCCVKLGTVVDQAVIYKAVSDTLDTGKPLTAADRVAMLLFLRRTSMGDIYKFEGSCPHCNHTNKNMQLDLSSVEISYVKDPTKRRVRIKLPSGGNAVLRVLAASGEKKLSGLKPSQKDVRTLAILARLEELNGQHIDSAHIDQVKRLSITDRNFIREVYNYIEGAVDTDVEIGCTKCSGEYKFPLDLGQIFFSNRAKKVTAADLDWI